MANIYGVVAEHTAPYKGYREVVQQPLGKEKGSTANAALWDGCFLNQKHSQYIAESQTRYYENFVGHISTSTKSVGQPFGDSLAFLRCRRLISPCMAVTINCPVVSPSSLTDSIASTTSCGARACTFCDLLFTWSRCTTELLCFRWNPVYRKKEIKKELRWNPVSVYTGFQLSVAALNNSEAPEDCSPPGASNHNVSRSNTMACSHDTQTRPKFVYLFLGIPEDFPGTTPTVLRVEADTEVDARSKLPHWTLTFAAQIRTESPCRLQLFSTDEGFIWIYEQRQTSPEEKNA
ncbi:host cell division inhibitor Icd-like protein [Serratia rubidaea]|uniref:Host cell division inhibitor Icd-like protein n=2 Tax=Serratia rubidaea TaxID=61652 RepID=A0ABS0MEU8_SERRU|nr:host cell division inhibitor Icd-like protein [Serratia rubidaea]